MHRLLLVILSAFIIVACSVSNKVDTELAEIEKIMNDHPDSALYRLQHIDTNSLNTDRRDALYRLLYSQALDKNYIDITSDSIIAPAVEYFNGSDDEYHKILATYYSGVIKENAGQRSSALCTFMKAYDMALRDSNYYWAGRAASMMTDIFDDFYLSKEAIKYAKITLENFRKAKNTLFADYSLGLLARMYGNAGVYDSSVIISDMLLDTLKLRPNEYHERLCYALKANTAYREYADYNAAIKFFDMVKNKSLLTVYDRCILGICYVKAGYRKEADSIENEMKKNPSPLLDASFMSAKMRYSGDYENGLKYYKSHYLQMKDEIHAVQSQNISDAIFEMRKSEIVEKEKQIKYEKYKIYCYIAFYTVLILALIYMIFMFNRKNKRKIERNLLIAENLRELLVAKEKENDSYKEKMVKTIIESKISSFDSLCKTCFENSGSDKENTKAKVSEQIDELITELSKKSKLVKELETLADEYTDGIITSFKNDFPKIKREDYLVFLYSLLGFSTMSIAFIIGESNVQSVYSRKKRLKERIMNSDAERREEYIKRMR